MSETCDNKCDDCNGEACACDPGTDVVFPLSRSNRLIDWLYFSQEVEDHIEKYAVLQYGDRPGDLLSKWSAEACLVAAEKYLVRRHSNVRDDKMRDLLKCVHFIQVAFSKMTSYRTSHRREDAPEDELTHYEPETNWKLIFGHDGEEQSVPNV